MRSQMGVLQHANLWTTVSPSTFQAGTLRNRALRPMAKHLIDRVAGDVEERSARALDVEDQLRRKQNESNQTPGCALAAAPAWKVGEDRD